MRRALPLAVALFAASLAGEARAAPVLLISIDGLRPADVLEAEARGLQVSNLRRFVEDGAYATGVVGVLPSVTYPSHTTLMTGVPPAVHGIVNNTTYDPLQINQGGWFWYAEDNKARTLWDVAHDAGLSTGNVHWPVSVAAKNVTWNLPQIWRTGHEDDRKLVKALATPGLVEDLESETGMPYADGKSEDLTGDRIRSSFAEGLIMTRRPGFLTVYFSALDHIEHESGPGSPQAKAALEQIDNYVGDLIAAETKAHPDAVIALVSDHGFAPVDTVINLYRPFIDAGLVTLGPDGKITSADATPWGSGGSFAIRLARPDDAALKAKVKAVLDKLAADPAARIARVIEGPEIAKAGANPEASFYVNLKIGAVAGPFVNGSLPLAFPSPVKGMHGYFPAAPEMRSTFMIMGPGIPAGRSLGEVDMRSIAPTLAKLMGGTLPDAEMPAISFGK
ncbi:ectonucleotide pyrophosphatase/phosphodiesterase [Novosphingobium sp.]|uniref:alkaline phosphatase family protein n=1 Tax=Novosphingobium sp. TaxID=1874826 RepID=UPI001DBAE79A|nr:ectonucleotide pyrophosphatase/phosphodiesterase [Novosphingobium sp.]MBX9665947.1 ectonucleotide pyrophosphatase/phosphodiesterase [Novosphingobium sp.]